MTTGVAANKWLLGPRLRAQARAFGAAQLLRTKPQSAASVVRMKQQLMDLMAKGGRTCIFHGNIFAIGFAFLFVLIILTLPVLRYSHPPFVDFPNHLARHYIESLDNGNLSHGQATYIQLYYDFKWRLVPYLAADILYHPLTRIMSVYDAGRLVIFIIIFLWLLAPMVVHRLLWGHYSIWPLFSALVIYNASLSWGFEDYVLSVPLSMLAFALWIGWAKQSTTLHLIIFTAIATLLYFAHLIAFALLGLLILAYEAGALVRTPNATIRTAAGRLLLSSLPFSLGTSLFLFLAFHAPAGTGSTTTSFGGILDRALVFASPVMEIGSPATAVMDIATLIVLGLVLFAGYRHNGWLKVHTSMGPVLLALAVISLVMPTKLFGVWATQVRLPPVVAVMFIGATRWEGMPRKFAWWLVMVVAILLVTSTLVRLDAWKKSNREGEEIITAFRELKYGARLLVATSPSYKFPLNLHSASYAVIERQVFLPTLFTGYTSLLFKPAFRRIAALQTAPIPVAVMIRALNSARTNDNTSPANGHYWRTWWQDFSDVLILGDRSDGNPIPRLLEVIYRGSFFTLYCNRGFDGRAGRYRARDKLSCGPSAPTADLRGWEKLKVADRPSGAASSTRTK